MTEPRFEFRRGAAQDAAGIVALVIDGLEPDVRRYTIYDQYGAIRFLEDQLGYAAPWTASDYWVVSYGSQLVGVAELIRSPASLFLNHIYVHRQFRGCGVGTGLLTNSLAANHHRGERLDLDVSRTNEAAARWYESLGLEHQSEKHWYLMRRSANSREYSRSAVGCAYARDLSFSNLQVQRYGFGRFSVTTSTATYSVGVLGSAYFRLHESAALTDPDLQFCLSRIDAARDILLTSGSQLESEDLLEVAAFNRMSGPTSTILEALRGDVR